MVNQDFWGKFAPLARCAAEAAAKVSSAQEEYQGAVEEMKSLQRFSCTNWNASAC